MLVLTLAPSILLVVVGLRLFQDDRAAELRSLRERREYAVGRVGAALERALHQIETRLAQSGGSDLVPHIEQVRDAAIITIRDGVIEVRPPVRLAYLPNTAVDSLDNSDAFIPGEFLEYVRNDPPGAMLWYRNAARHAASAEKAEALVRLARTLRRQGAVDEALATYSELTQLRQVSVAGVPAELLGRWMKCDLLNALHRRSELTAEAAALLADLRRGGWRIGRAAFEVHLNDAARWAGLPVPPIPTPSESFARAVDDLLRQRREWDLGGTAHEQRHLVATEEGLGAAVVRNDASRTTVFVALPSYVRREWITPEQRWLESEHLAVTLEDPEQRESDSSTARLRAGDSGLPWTLGVAYTDANAEVARLAGRRKLWLAALAALATLILTGTAVAARAVSSELAVARVQSDFVSAVSHEFRTPLTSLRQIGEVLQERRVTTNERRAEYYDALVRQTDRLQRLVEALLDFGRMEAGAATYKREPVDIDQVVGAVVEEFRDEAISRGEHAEIHVTSEATTVLGDREALANAVRNLLDNAIKYSPRRPEAWVETRVENDGVAISVRDRGIGIPPREQREIFRKFTRGARATSERIKGTGIGLAIVQHVVEGHGGRVSVASQPDAGSTFTIWLPGSGARDAARGSTGGDQVSRANVSVGRLS